MKKSFTDSFETTYKFEDRDSDMHAIKIFFKNSKVHPDVRILFYKDKVVVEKKTSRKSLVSDITFMMKLVKVDGLDIAEKFWKLDYLGQKDSPIIPNSFIKVLNNLMDYINLVYKDEKDQS